MKRRPGYSALKTSSKSAPSPAENFMTAEMKKYVLIHVPTDMQKILKKKQPNMWLDYFEECQNDGKYDGMNDYQKNQFDQSFSLLKQLAAETGLSVQAPPPVAPPPKIAEVLEELPRKAESIAARNKTVLGNIVDNAKTAIKNANYKDIGAGIAFTVIGGVAARAIRIGITSMFGVAATGVCAPGAAMIAATIGAGLVAGAVGGVVSRSIQISLSNWRRQRLLKTMPRHKVPPERSLSKEYKKAALFGALGGAVGVGLIQHLPVVLEAMGVPVTQIARAVGLSEPPPRLHYVRPNMSNFNASINNVPVGHAVNAPPVTVLSTSSVPTEQIQIASEQTKVVEPVTQPSLQVLSVDKAQVLSIEHAQELHQATMSSLDEMYEACLHRKDVAHSFVRAVAGEQRVGNGMLRIAANLSNDSTSPLHGISKQLHALQTQLDNPNLNDVEKSRIIMNHQPEVRLAVTKLDDYIHNMNGTHGGFSNVTRFINERDDFKTADNSVGQAVNKYANALREENGIKSVNTTEHVTQTQVTPHETTDVKQGLTVADHKEGSDIRTNMNVKETGVVDNGNGTQTHKVSGVQTDKETIKGNQIAQQNALLQQRKLAKNVI